MPIIPGSECDFFCILQTCITFTLKCDNYIQILDKVCLCKKFIHCIHRIAPADTMDFALLLRCSSVQRDFTVTALMKKRI